MALLDAVLRFVTFGYRYGDEFMTEAVVKRGQTLCVR
jgi:hypothetical protein